MKRKTRTAAQKRWHDYLASLGCVVCGQGAQVHHCVGASAKHRKVDVGHWFCIPLCDHHHKPPHGIHGNLAGDFGRTRKEFEKLHFGNIAKNSSLIDRDLVELILSYTR